MMNHRNGRFVAVEHQSSAAPRSGPSAGGPRVALYSHDTMGLGHMRRNLLIAQALMRAPEAPSILMLAGAREAGALRLPPGVDCLTLPALGKDPQGRLRARHLALTLPELIRLRSTILAAALEAFRPDVLIVDKVPRGASEELIPALEMLKASSDCRCVLGLRDILDDPRAVRLEWAETRSDEAIARYYDAVWVYGDPALYDPVAEYGLSGEVARKVRYTGYLDPKLRLSGAEPGGIEALSRLGLPNEGLILCQLGGGQDGAELAEAFVQAELPPGSHGVLLTGPYLPADARVRVQRAAEGRPRLRVLETLAEPGWLLRRADRVIAMGGYNTVSEVLSFEKPALIVPRIHPRREQWIRAERLRNHGLLDVLHPDHLTPEALAQWMASPTSTRPSDRSRFDWSGLEKLPRLLEDLLVDPYRNIPRVYVESEEFACPSMLPSESATS